MFNMQSIKLDKTYDATSGINVSYGLKPQENGVLVSAEFKPFGSLAYKRWEAVLPTDQVEKAFKGLDQVGEGSLSLDARIIKSSGMRSDGSTVKVGRYITIQGEGASISFGQTYQGQVRVNMRKSKSEGLELMIEFAGMKKPITGFGLPDGVVIEYGK